MSDVLKGIMFGAVMVVVLLGVSMALSAPIEHQQSWSEAVWNGNIEGDPMYYADGRASIEEIGHAVITATNQIKADQWVPPPLNATEADPQSYCRDKTTSTGTGLWEYRTEPGVGYWPQAFASDNERYESITMFDDFYGPVTFLWPSPNRAYEHPAGGYDRMIVCWTDEA